MGIGRHDGNEVCFRVSFRVFCMCLPSAPQAASRGEWHERWSRSKASSCEAPATGGRLLPSSVPPSCSPRASARASRPLSIICSTPIASRTYAFIPAKRREDQAMHTGNLGCEPSELATCHLLGFPMMKTSQGGQQDAAQMRVIGALIRDVPSECIRHCESSHLIITLQNLI